ncbi:MAG: hypothetical protein KA436_06770 [Oligoflexales bacterium]|nr:hypothetical protein [Oligoflexales bacterium]
MSPHRLVMLLTLFFCFPTTLLTAACKDSGYENGVPKCEDDAEYAVTHYIMSFPHFKRWHLFGKKFEKLYISDAGADESWTTLADRTNGFFTFGPYLNFDFPGSLLVKFYLRCDVYVSPHRNVASDDLFTLDLSSDQGSLIKKTYRLSDFECEDLGKGFANCFFYENPPIGVGVEDTKFPKATSAAHLSSVTQSGISGFEARIFRNSNVVDIVVTKIVITYTRK